MTLTVKLAQQEKARLEALAAAMNAETQSDVVRALINEKYESLQMEKTFVERRGGLPKHFLDGPPGLSERANRQALIAAKVAERAARRAK